jgi:C1A family cysteine protease
MAEIVETLGMGWVRDYPDIHDYTVEREAVADKLKALGQRDSIKDMLKKVGVGQAKKAVTVPTSVDLRAWCPPIENQLNLGSCTAHAGVGVVEYFERRAFGSHIDASRLFLYKVREIS